MSGKAMLVHRTMEVSQKKSTITFKSLDGVIKTQDESGRTVSSSHTCSEMEKTIPLMLGVSKAVLDNVVFVHQEDSCWVLQEGAVLKTKFDAIFDSTKYAKALEAIKETKKRYANKVKDLKAELNLLQGHKHAASSFRREYDQVSSDLSFFVPDLHGQYSFIIALLLRCIYIPNVMQTNENLSNVTDKIQELNQQIDDEMKKKTEFSNILSKVGNINQEVLEKTHQMEKESVRLETIKSTLKEDKTSQSLAELEALLSGFDASAGETLSELEGKKDYADNIKKDNATLQKRQHELIQRKGVLIGEKSNYENDLKRRVEIITQIHTNYDLKYDQSQGSYREGSFVDLGTQRSILSQGSVTTLGRLTMLSQESIPVIPDEELALFQRVIGEKRAEFATDLANLKKQHQQEDDRMQKGIGESMTDVRSLEAGTYKSHVTKSR
jgi:DNA repair protein RAD50